MLIPIIIDEFFSTRHNMFVQKKVMFNNITFPIEALDVASATNINSNPGINGYIDILPCDLF